MARWTHVLEITPRPGAEDGLYNSIIGQDTWHNLQLGEKALGKQWFLVEIKDGLGMEIADAIKADAEVESVILHVNCNIHERANNIHLLRKIA